MIDVTIIEQCGTEAVRKLRLQKLQNGRPFIINSRNLPPSQCYLEYPDGEIVLAALPNHAKDFHIIHVLSEDENARLRRKYNLPLFSLQCLIYI
jgi:hypothetical protein